MAPQTYKALVLERIGLLVIMQSRFVLPCRWLPSLFSDEVPEPDAEEEAPLAGPAEYHGQDSIN